MENNTNQNLNAAIIGFYRGATIEVICSIVFMWPGEVEHILNSYFKTNIRIENICKN